MVKIVLVDDHVLLRNALARLIGKSYAAIKIELFAIALDESFVLSK